MKKLNIGDEIKVVWLDICTYTRTEKDKIDQVANLEDLMARTTSYGKIYRLDDNIIILLSEDSKSEVDFTTITTIPRKLIKKISFLHEEAKPDKGGKNEPKRKKKSS